ncbi:MAG: ATP-binding protein [Bacteroidales bacterium]|nr:ATP-binding protein [Bacteroidales bacterium]
MLIKYKKNRLVSKLQRHLRSRKFQMPDEAVFDDFYAKRMYAQARMALVLGFLTWCIFAIWDYISFGNLLIYLLSIRLLIIAPCIGLLCWISIYKPDVFIRNMQLFLFLAVASVTVGIFLLIIVAASEYGAFAYTMLWPGLLIIYLMQYTFSRMRFKPALFLGLITFWVAFLTGIIVDVPVNVFSSSLFYLGSGNALGMIVCSRMEAYERTVFLIRRRYINQLHNAKEQKNIAQLANDRLIEAHAEKERFFSAAYHDLQGPLSIIGMYIQLGKTKLQSLSITALDKEMLTIENAKNEIAFMYKEIRDISDIGKIDVNIDNVDINLILEELEIEFMEVALAKNLRFKVKKRIQQPFHIKTERVLFKRLLTNLISNAIKYTEKGGITVGAVDLKSYLRVDVWDTGKGIPDEFKSTIFDEYVQLDNPGRDRSRGLGLGLSIVQRIVKLLSNFDHQLNFNSTINKGSRFSVYAPIAYNTVITELVENNTDNIPGRLNVLHGKYIVVVDDEPDLLNGLIAFIEKLGCFVNGADSVQNFRKIIDESERIPDMVITDFRLKDGETALDVINVLKEVLDWEVKIPIMIVTGELVLDEAIKNLGIHTDIYRKPIEFDSLQKKMSDLIVRV